MAKKGFDAEGFYKAVTETLAERGKNWKMVAEETGISASTLARMAKGSQPDASSLAALSAWSGINPSNFVDAPYKTMTTDSLGQIASLLRSDPNLDTKAAESMEKIIKAAYSSLKK